MKFIIITDKKLNIDIYKTYLRLRENKKTKKYLLKPFKKLY